jgi:BirA family transcriptional regulator, biotin operon repressor / biotin---[acetyl-CoA-carboxylase] ligase
LLHQILHFDEIDSTNSEIERQANRGAADGLWVRADVQTAGRGRRGRAWVSPRGNLYATGLVRLSVHEPPAQQLSFVAALAVYDSVAPLVPQKPLLRLKWPNDLLYNGHKLAGILLEAGGQRGQAASDPITSGPITSGQAGFVGVGIGVNLAHHPEAVERTATSIYAITGGAPDPAAFLEALVTSFAHWRLMWRTHGFAPLHSAWLDRAAGLGEAIEVRLGTYSLKGRFKGLDKDGALLLEQDDASVRPIYAGDVFGL